MKKRDWGCLAVLLPLIVILTTVCGSVGILTAYNRERNTIAWDYFEGLEKTLADSETKQLPLLEQDLARWLSTYRKLNVSDVHEPVLERVRQLHTEAKGLPDRHRIGSPEYQNEHRRIQTAVRGVPRIGEAAFSENHPWWTGLWRFAKMPLLVLAACAAIFCVIGFFMAEVKEPPKGGGGSSGGGSYGGGGFGYPNGGYRPEYRGPPNYYGSFGEDESGNTGYPPFGTC